MNKVHQISTNLPKITPLTTVKQAQIKGGMASMDEEKKAKAKKVKH